MKKVIFFIFCVAIFITACEDEFTEQQRIGVQPIEEFFASEENADKALVGLYDTMQETYIGLWDLGQGAFLTRQIFGDDMNKGGGDAADQSQYFDLHNFNIDPNNLYTTGMWRAMYKSVNFANFVINEMEKTDFANKEEVIAEAKFIKAWNLFELTKMYGDIPLKSEFTTTIEGFSIAKSSQAEVYAQIEQDLMDAIPNMADKSNLEQAFRFSKGAAQALMGKVLVYQGRHAEALPFLQDVINNPAHDLEPNVADVWNGTREYGQESLVEVGAVSSIGYAWGGREADWAGGQESNLYIQLMGPREGEFNLGNTGIIEGWGFNLPSRKLIDAFEAGGDNARKSASILTTAELQAAGGSVGSPYDYEGAIRVKYAPRADNSNPAATTQLNYGNNFHLMRYAEVLFLAAEAYIELGQDGNARTELNKIRTRAGATPIAATVSGQALFDTMVDDKFLELSQEGQRYWDLVRWGIESPELVARGKEPRHNLMPIPREEIEKNDQINQEDQNPGY
ncbi:RagB/SusD family nutrient uptake outer membrane protein [Nonlabens xiamenensis]|uniref:RagB/SusD family nutrient uptake outer membrane protein n=1 Tax=Nonlabens xiamenensis TaxID=2341043 RepID=UPI000F613A12|nr:RagB/SusD family nutrient uptake outer membrane protein [Nonlabens xiamenensis]